MKKDLLLVSPDLSEGNGTGPVPVGLLDTSSGGGFGTSCFSGCLSSDWPLAQYQRGDNESLRCFRGAFPPVDFRAVCLVRAIVLIGCWGWK
jgi:hypothetical protein